MEKEEEEGTEKSVTEQALRESRAKFLSITVLFKKKGRQLEQTQQLRWKGLSLSLGRKWISTSRPARKTVPNYSGKSRPLLPLRSNIWSSHLEIHFLPLGLDQDIRGKLLRRNL